MKEYVIERATAPVPLTDAGAGTPWERARTLELDEFMWRDGGPTPETTGRVLYDDDALYLRFDVEDRAIHADVTELNGPTFEDSSVELFARPVPDADDRYFNFEANCCGQFKLAWQEPDWQARGVGRELVSPATAARVDVETSVPGPTRAPRPDDESWWLAARLPFDVLADLTGLDCAPASGTTWRANAYRSGVPDAEKSTWNPIDEPEPVYHSPEYFGRFRFA